ncbi:MAG: acetyltransferase [Microgenomates group bacterium GW2011_GWC1_43_11]|uniref:Acetyltransferase n=2 Tax=Candidatus Gottesmaniibacteriota TaxID=1752720 RepID=A0A0G1LNB4_9BACT|nr:MAG: acetyltransferase [Microgenomates group bacterium GW2011_GWC1_43_11]KKT38969.1 MAG: Acetyltransferase [Candidatus Gottesmanbacteria bacterium GW2011_GWB1_44_11c]KKT61394.1 MAG: Acetyltransferase [Candidatus Gottesmanbacteria bacterium GW2011_GWA1_44_24b]HCM81771.1 acyltransferase [Patescibacteria group bacterium]
MRAIIDFWVFLATLTGLIPSHTIRLFFYRYFFRVKIGKDSTIHWLARFNQPSGISIGHNTVIGNDAFLDGRVKREWKGRRPNALTYLQEFFSPREHPLTIGNNVSIAGEVRIFTMQHDIDDPDFKEVSSPVIIEDYVVIGTRVTILPGVTIGKGAVAASGAVVTHDIAPFTVVGGIPAVFIRNRAKNLRYTLKFARLFQ